MFLACVLLQLRGWYWAPSLSPLDKTASGFAALETSTHASHARRGIAVARTSAQGDGARVTLMLPRNSYPRSGLTKARVMVRSISHPIVLVDTEGGFNPAISLLCAAHPRYDPRPPNTVQTQTARSGCPKIGYLELRAAFGDVRATPGVKGRRNADPRT